LDDFKDWKFRIPALAPLKVPAAEGRAGGSALLYLTYCPIHIIASLPVSQALKKNYSHFSDRHRAR
jgi:hypothetical protein